MSNTGKFRDSVPFIRSAGLTTTTGGVSSDHSLRQDVYFKVKNYNFSLVQARPKKLKSIVNPLEMCLG